MPPAQRPGRPVPQHRSTTTRAGSGEPSGPGDEEPAAPPRDEHPRLDHHPQPAEHRPADTCSSGCPRPARATSSPRAAGESAAATSNAASSSAYTQPAARSRRRPGRSPLSPRRCRAARSSRARRARRGRRPGCAGRPRSRPRCPRPGCRPARATRARATRQPRARRAAGEAVGRQLGDLGGHQAVREHAARVGADVDRHPRVVAPRTPSRAGARAARACGRSTPGTSRRPRRRVGEGREVDQRRHDRHAARGISAIMSSDRPVACSTQSMPAATRPGSDSSAKQCAVTRAPCGVGRRDRRVERVGAASTAARSPRRRGRSSRRPA